MYRLFYNHEVIGDVLLIMINPEAEVTSHKELGSLSVLFHEKEIVGINVFDISKTLRIKATGILFSPNDVLIDAVNAILLNASLPKLPYCTDSGYHVAEITHLEEHPLDEKAQIVTLALQNETCTTVSWFSNLRVGARVVVASEGTILADGKVFHSFTSRNIPNEATILSPSELHLSSVVSEAHITEGYDKGEDFFLGGR